MQCSMLHGSDNMHCVQKFGDMCPLACAIKGMLTQIPPTEEDEDEGEDTLWSVRGSGELVLCAPEG